MLSRLSSRSLIVAGVVTVLLALGLVPAVAGDICTIIPTPGCEATTPLTPNIDVSVPPSFGRGADPTVFTARITNPPIAPPYNVTVDFTIIGPDGFDAGDLVLEYETSPGSGEYLPIPLTDADANTVTGRFGPADGFPVAPGYDVTTNLRATFDDGAPLGALRVQTNLNDADTPASAPLSYDQDESQIAAPTLDVAPPATLGAGAPAAPFTARLANATGSNYSAVRVDFTLTGIAGLTASQVTLEYEDPATPGSFLPVPLANGDDGTITGSFGPADGFPLPNGYDATTNFRTSVAAGAPTGTLQLTTDLVTLSGGAVTGTVASDTDTITVAAPTIAVAVPASLGAGAPPTGFTGRVMNPTGADYPAVRVDVTLSGVPGLAADDVQLEYQTGPDTYAAIPLTDGAGDTIRGSFGPAEGFPLPNGYDATTNFRVAIAAGAPTGILVVASDLVAVSDGAPTATLASDRDEATIGAPTIGVNPPARLGVGAPPAGFTARITNTTASDYPAVRADFTLSGIDGLRAEDVTLEYETAPGSGNYVAIPLRDVSDGPVVGSFGPDAGFPMPSGYDATTNLRVSFDADAPTGDLVVDTRLVTVSGGDATSTVAADHDTIAIGRPVLAAAPPASVVTGAAPEPLDVRITNATGSAYPATRVDFTFSGIRGLDAGDVVLERETSPGSGTYTRVALANGSGDSITGTSGPTAGTALPDGADQTTRYRLSIAKGAPTGSLVIATALVTVENGKRAGTLTSDGDTTSVRAPASGGTGARPRKPGYWFVASDGGVFSFGSRPFHGSTGDLRLNKPIVDLAATPDEGGYWLVATDGGIFSFGNATFFGSTGDLRLNQPIVGMATTPTGKGYWLVASDGGIFSFGDARFFGSTGDVRLNQPIVGMAATPTGKGYWLVASDGGIFTFGDAGFFGSAGSIKLKEPILAMAPTPAGDGYWLLASDGGVFTFGDAQFHGSTGATKLNQPIVDMASTSTGDGYWLVASDGGVFTFGDAQFFGSTGDIRLNKPIVGMT